MYRPTPRSVLSPALINSALNELEVQYGSHLCDALRDYGSYCLSLATVNPSAPPRMYRIPGATRRRVIRIIACFLLDAYRLGADHMERDRVERRGTKTWGSTRDQIDIDALLAPLVEGEQVAKAPTPPPPETAGSSSTKEQIDIDSLLAGLEAEEQGIAKVTAPEVVDQVAKEAAGVYRVRDLGVLGGISKYNFTTTVRGITDTILSHAEENIVSRLSRLDRPSAVRDLVEKYTFQVPNLVGKLVNQWSPVWYDQGRYHKAMADPVTEGFRVVSQRDRLVCPICQIRDGATFRKDSVSLLYTPFHLRCRCFLEVIPISEWYGEHIPEGLDQHPPQKGFGRSEVLQAVSGGTSEIGVHSVYVISREISAAAAETIGAEVEELLTKSHRYVPEGVPFTLKELLGNVRHAATAERTVGRGMVFVLNNGSLVMLNPAAGPDKTRAERHQLGLHVARGSGAESTVSFIQDEQGRWWATTHVQWFTPKQDLSVRGNEMLHVVEGEETPGRKQVSQAEIDDIIRQLGR